MSCATKLSLILFYYHYLNGFFLCIFLHGEGRQKDMNNKFINEINLIEVLELIFDLYMDCCRSFIFIIDEFYKGTYLIFPQSRSQERFRIK